MKGCRSASLILLLTCSLGCGALPSYQIKVGSSHKDVVNMVVYLPDRAGPEVYRRIALQELQRIRTSGTGGLPLYEVNFEFRRNDGQRDRLARVLVRMETLAQVAREELADAPGPVLETILY
jgi:hypothetical protein